MDHPTSLHECPFVRSVGMLEELGLPYQLKMWAFPPRVTDKSFLEINPLGTVPALSDGDVHMTESAAMCQYLAMRAADTPLIVAPHEAGSGAYLTYLHLGEATLTCP